MVIERAMELIPYRPITVETPMGSNASGKIQAPLDICGISIIRSGGPLEKGLRRVIRDVRIGSLLIQTDPESGESLLLHSMLPSCVKERERSGDAWVLLLDAQIATGAAAFMAIRVLLDHGVREDHIIFATFVVARNGGIRHIRRCFPSVKFVIGAVDEKLVEVKGPGFEDEERSLWNIEPGIGHVGDRYFSGN
ncbi:Uridine kinase [Tulasnella sp. 418]|nr:Uridine kinase [Tulasnella sp. 418]